MNNNHSAQSGFTLVELSIVLVIIGLLIGGILVGQSLIESAKLNSVIKQLSQIDIAVEQFRTKYKYFPGDSPRHSPSIGNGNNIVENALLKAGSANTTNGAFNDEIANFWPQLQQDGFLVSGYPTFSNTATSGIRTGTNIPALNTDKKTGLMPFVDQTPDYYSFKFMIANFEGSTSNAYVPGTAAVTPSLSLGFVMALDNKIDDGYAYTANLNLYPNARVSTSSTSPSCYNATGTYYLYNASYTGNCLLIVKTKMQSNGSMKY